MHFKMIDASLQVYVILIFFFFFLSLFIFVHVDAMCGVSAGNTVAIIC